MISQAPERTTSRPSMGRLIFGLTPLRYQDRGSAWHSWGNRGLGLFPSRPLDHFGLLWGSGLGPRYPKLPFFYFPPKHITPHSLFFITSFSSLHSENILFSLILCFSLFLYKEKEMIFSCSSLFSCIEKT